MMVILRIKSGFILDKNFKESLKYDNFTINGYQISKNTTGDNRINLYDQTLYGVSENKANGVFFSLDGKSINKNTFNSKLWSTKFLLSYFSMG